MIDKIMKKNLITAVLIALGLTSCTSKDEYQPGLPKDKQLSLEDIDNIEFEPRGSSVILSFTAAGNWTLSSSTSVFKIESGKTNGREGTHSVKISAELNSLKKTLEGILIFQSSNTTKEISLSQPFPYLDVDIVNAEGVSQTSDTVRFLWNESNQAGSKQFNVVVKSNIDWKINLTPIDGNAFNIDEKYISGFGDNESIPIVVNKNNIDKIPYFTKFFVEGYMDNSFDEAIQEEVIEPYSTILRQNNLKFLMNDSCDTPEVQIDELNKTIIVDNDDKLDSIIVDSELPWTVKDNSSGWLEIHPTNGQAGQTTVRVRAAAGTETEEGAPEGTNPYDKERTGEIILASAGGAERTINVKQDAYKLEPSAYSMRFINNEDNKELLDSITFLSSGPWQIEDTGFPEWLTVSPMKGEAGETTIRFTNSKQNLKLEDDSQGILFQSKWNRLERKVNVSQAKFDFEHSFDQDYENITATSDKNDRYKLHINSSGEWKLESKANWLNFAKPGSEEGAQIFEGKGKMDIDFYATVKNPDLHEDRIASIDFRSFRHEKAGIKLDENITNFSITQEKFIFEVNMENNTAPAFTTSKKLEMFIKCSDEWKIKYCPSWLKADKESGRSKTTETVRFTPETNISVADRTDSIIVISTYNNDKKKIIVKQDGFIFKTDKSSITKLNPINVPVTTVKLSCTEEAGWSITSDNWISADNTKGIGNADLKFTISDNPYTASRTGVATIKSDVQGISEQKISFSQEAFKFSSSVAGSYSFKALPSTSDKFSFYVNSSGRWNIESDNDISWLSFSTKSGSGIESGESVTFSAGNNTSTSARSASIRIRSYLYPQNTALQKVFSVSQEAYIWNINAQNYNFTFDNDLNTQSTTIGIICTGNWEINSGNCNWLKFSNEKGSGNATVKVAPTSNQDAKRSATVTIKCTDNEELYKVVEYTQDGFAFTTDKTSIQFTSDGGNGSVKVSCSSNWTASTTDSSWISLTTTSGSYGNDIPMNFSVDKNNTKAERKGKITIKSGKFGKTIEIEIVQAK